MADHSAFLDGNEQPGPHDAFLNAPSTPAPVTVSNPYETTAKGQSFLENLTAGAGGAVEGWKLGLQQLLGRPPTNAEVAEYQKSMSSLRGTAGGVLGEVVANLAPGTAVMKGVSLIPKAAGLLTAGGAGGALVNIGAGMGTGAIEGAMVPVTDTESRGENILKNAAYGGAGAAVIGAATKIGRTMKDAIAPYFSSDAAKLAGGKILNTVAGKQSQDVIDALKASKPIISGQTAGQAAAEAGSPEFLAIQNIVDKLHPATASSVEKTQKLGRLAAIDTFAKDETALNAAITARKTAADVNYSKALSGAIKGDSELGSILRDPFVQDTIPSIRKLVEHSNAKGKPVPLGEQLQMIKKELDGTLAGTPLNKPSDNQARAVLEIQSRLENWMKNKIPGYESAVDKYAEDSSKILQMRIGQRARDILESPLGTKERGSLLAKTVEEETALLKKTGGFTREDLKAQLEPQNMEKLQKVIKELDVDSNFNELASKGMSGEAVKKTVGGVLQLPDLMNAAVTLTNSAVKRVYGASKIKTLEELSTMMQDPIMTASIMEKASKKEANAIKFLMRSMQAGAIATPAFTSTQQGNK